MSADGNTGYAIEYDYNGDKGLNNLVAVFNTSMTRPAIQGAIYSILTDAILNGANVLDCYASRRLANSYYRMGFVPTGIVDFTDRYLSEEEKRKFREDKLGTPYVMAMRYADKDIGETVRQMRNRNEIDLNSDDVHIRRYDCDGYERALKDRDAIQLEHLTGSGRKSVLDMADNICASPVREAGNTRSKR